METLPGLPGVTHASFTQGPPWGDSAQTDSKENLALSGASPTTGEVGEQVCGWLRSADDLVASQSSRGTEAAQGLTLGT